jgi:copine 1/2/3
MEGIMNIYKQQVKLIEFSGPALLHDLLNYTKIVADSNAKKKIYTVLLVLTCGQIHDFQKTIDLISTGNNLLI